MEVKNPPLRIMGKKDKVITAVQCFHFTFGQSKHDFR